jgi:aspartate/methionine/tyrosine aminotransferase
VIADHPILTAQLPAATPFLWLELGGLSSDNLLAAGIAVVDGSAFGAPGHARLPFGGAASLERLRSSLQAVT